MKFVVFLDIDGPFINQRSAIADLDYDPIAVSVLNQVVEHPDVRIVISSVWRTIGKTAVEAAPLLQKKIGLSPKAVFHEQWRTGRNYGGGPDGSFRSKELVEWLDLYREDNVTYIAVDDDAINIPGVLHIKADYNGIPFDYLWEFHDVVFGNENADEIATHRDWMRRQNKQML